MAETVSTILDYLRQHHFLQAEAALKAELAGRDLPNGLFSLEVDLGIANAGAKQQSSDEESAADISHAKDDLSGILDAVKIDSRSEKANSTEQQDISRPTDNNGKFSAGHLAEGFWEQKDELLWVPANPWEKQGIQLGKVHPLDEATPRACDDRLDAAAADTANHLSLKVSTEFWMNSQQHILNNTTFGNEVLPTLERTGEDIQSEQKNLDEKEAEDLSVKVELLKVSTDDSEILKCRLIATSQEAETAEPRTIEFMKDSDTTRREGLPRLPPVRLKSIEKIPNDWISEARLNTDLDLDMDMDTSFALGSYLDVPFGQDISSSGTKRSGGSNRPSVSQGIIEDPAELLSSFATIGDGSALDYPDDYWDSDAYEDDDDPGYTRRSIEDEAGFLENEINYPSEDEKARNLEARGSHHQDRSYPKYDDDDRSFVESYFSGEEYYRAGDVVEQEANRNPDNRIERSDLSSLRHRSSKEYDGQLLDAEELKQIRAEPAWQGFAVQGKATTSSSCGILGDADDFSREIRESYLAESSEGDVGEWRQNSFSANERFCGVSSQFTQPNMGDCLQEIEEPGCTGEDEHDIMLNYYGRSAAWGQSNGCAVGEGNAEIGVFQFGGFSFPSPSSGGGGDIGESRAESGRSLWSARDASSRNGEDPDEFGNAFVGPDDTLASWKRKSNESSPIISPGGDDTDVHLALSTRSTMSAPSTDDCLSVRDDDDDDDDDDDQKLRGKAAAVAAAAVDDEDGDDDEIGDVVESFDEEAIAVHEHFQRLQAEEDEFETFDLKIIHRKNRTGFEEEKDFQVVINSVIAGRYHVTEYLGSAAFSKAIQAHDLHTGMDVCMKIIKNNKDFFDQSLDEIKLLKYINKHDPGDKHHILRLYDYFYHREHLFIVCELLRANLYEFHKYNRESGGEVYFTMPRLQSITRQCLEALEFLHGLGLIHCDLKPENILVKSYSRCEVKVIDLGSSCFQTDHLCSYVQSRSYRAPEVILGLPYHQKIDIWSLGCILAELCSGNVLFQNDSLATLLARVIGIIGQIDPEMISKGRDSYKFFTKNHMLYERNPGSDRLEYLMPKRTNLAHRLPMGDDGFIEFVGYLLEINPNSRPTATQALNHPWLSYPYEPISS